MAPADNGPDGRVALVDGASFCIARPNGDLAGGSDGLYVADRRTLGRAVLRVNGCPALAVDQHLDDPGSATFVGRVAGRSPAAATSPVGGDVDSDDARPGPIVIRRRTLAGGMRDDVEIRNVGDEPTYVEVELDLATDLAAAAGARDGRHEEVPAVSPRSEGGSGDSLVVTFVRGRGAGRGGCHVTVSSGATVDGGTLRWEAIVPAGGSTAFSMVVSPIVDGEPLEPSHLPGSAGERSGPRRRFERWHQGVPQVETDHHDLLLAVRRSARDLGALRVLDPEFPERAVVAAGSPWYLALHGRDALLAAHMGLVLDPDLALGTLETLARFQGSEVDDRTEEQPGRIAHRLRLGPRAFGAGTHAVSYGSVDATPLFVMLLGEMRRWGLAPELVDRLLPHVDRALDWICEWGDRDGDGYVEYQRRTDRGVRHQSWKDSAAPIRHPDGRPARGPIAPAEVQGYVYAAYLARAHFALEVGDDRATERWRRKAAELKAAFNRDFWLADRDAIALALDGDKRPVASLASNVGHCLWTGILDEDAAAVVVKHLMADDLFSGWGLRTLASSTAGYDPVAPHTGAVWPHDNAVCVAGMVRYGFVEEAHRILLAQLEASAREGANGRLSVLCGFGRDDVQAPVRFPDSCTARALSAAAPLSFLRSLLRLDPWVPQGKLWLAPALPDAVGRLSVERIPLIGGRVTVSVDGNRVAVDGLPPGIELVGEPRRPLTAEG
ncbi:MAG: glycogen debranching N-terminal domain-containing protein [Acidimicrobiia bacterium]